MKNKKKYTPGMEDVERVIDHLKDKERKSRQEEWLRQNHSKQANLPSSQLKKEQQNESNG